MNDRSFKFALVILLFTSGACLSGCRDSSERQVPNPAKASAQASPETSANDDPKPLETIKPEYAGLFTLERYSGGYVRLTVENEGEFALVPEGAPENDLGLEKPTFIRLPCANVYMAASSEIDWFKQLGILDKITTCGSKASSFDDEEISTRFANGQIQYAGKYSAPDYETILSSKCGLAIESTMIYHAPKVRERLEELGVPVFVSRANYENDPLGRLEWCKVYGVLFGKEREANEFFERARAEVRDVEAKLAANPPTTKKKVALFYVTSSGVVNVRKPGDYLCKSLELAGGTYALDELGTDADDSVSSISIDWEEFYRLAADSDLLIYNGAVDSDVNSLDDLIGKNEILKDFKAVKNGDVWLANMNVYREASKTARILTEFYQALADGSVQNAQFLRKLE